MSLSLEKIKLSLLKWDVIKGIRKDICAELPGNTLLWDLFEKLEDDNNSYDANWEGLSFKDLKKLRDELVYLVEKLTKEQIVGDDKLTLDRKDYDKINIIHRYPETTEQWKERLGKMKEENGSNPEAVKIIQTALENLNESEI